MSKATKISGYHAPAVEKAFLMLRFVAEMGGEPVRLSDLASHLGISKSSAHGLIKALVSTGALNQNPRTKKITLGPATVELALKNQIYLQLGLKAQSCLDELRDLVTETVFFGLLHPWRAVILATSETDRAMKISSAPGSTVNLIAGALGKVFLAPKRDEEVRETIKDQGLPQFTNSSITEEYAFLKELAIVRERGYAVDIGEFLSGVNAVAVGLEDQYGLHLALWVVGFAESFTIDKINNAIPTILSAADRLQKTLKSIQ